MTEKIYNVLFLCKGNSVRSIMAEALMTHWGKGVFQGFSAGSEPADSVHPYVPTLLGKLGVASDSLHPKSWKQFTGPDATVMDYVFTLSDDIPVGSAPVWPGDPITAHWGLPDPEQAVGSEAERMLAFRFTFKMLERRVQLFAALRHKEMSRAEASRRAAEIGQGEPEAAA
jgi:arsenate reductase